MLHDGPYQDDRELQAENRRVRENARTEVDKIWNEQQQKLASSTAAPTPGPITPPTWGTTPPPAPAETPVSAPSGNPPFVETPPSDPGIGVASRLDQPAPQQPDYWSGDPRPPGQIETIQ